jgi:cellulose synthase/poly-beta-1,6-N-acetylglucosamine synthase-like glycosyltransferase
MAIRAQALMVREMTMPMDPVEVLFWVAIAIVVYAYAGYAACVRVMAWLRPRPPRAGKVQPSVSLIVPAYNEGSYLAVKLENSLALDYPADRLEILVISSGSSDATEQIAEGYSSRGVRTLIQETRSGKEAAMQEAARHARGEILIFTDANALLNREAVGLMVRWFADPEVGCVSGEKRVLPVHGESAGAGEGAYWRYESALKRLDSIVGSTMGAPGELCAIRASLMTARERDNIIEDFVLSMRVVEAGYRIVHEPGATAVEEASERFEDVFERRARIAAGGFQSIWRLRSLLDPRHGLVWWQYVSHRVLRWGVVPVLLPLLVLANWTLSPAQPIYTVMLVAQFAFYGAAVTGWWLRRTPMGQRRLLSMPFFFFAANAAVLVGGMRLVTGRQTVLWKRTRP